MASTPLMKEAPSRSTPVFRPTAAPRRTPSFSSSSRSNSWGSSFESPPFSLNDESHPPFSPLKLTGIPFSWEQTPGIPKNHHFFRPKQPSGRHLLPLPPAGAATSAAKKHQASKRDPFFAALLECSKDDHDHNHDRDQDQDQDHGFKISKFGFINMYSSCKSTCAVSNQLFISRDRARIIFSIAIAVDRAEFFPRTISGGTGIAFEILIYKCQIPVPPTFSGKILGPERKISFRQIIILDPSLYSSPPWSPWSDEC